MPTDTEESQVLSDSSEAATPNTSTVRAPSASSSSVPSPPDSQSRITTRSMPTSTSGASIANSNGKRPLQTISNGMDEVEELQAMTNGKARADGPVKTTSSGYQYSRPEDEPGYSWMNKKAEDEAMRAWDSMAHKDSMVKGRYGDPFELVEKEQAIAASLNQQ